MSTEKPELHHGDHVDSLKEKDALHSEVLVNQDLLNDAFNGENHEHEEGVWAAAKGHPMACLWAFIMCFTIVCSSLSSRASIS